MSALSDAERNVVAAATWWRELKRQNLPDSGAEAELIRAVDAYLEAGNAVLTRP